MRQPLFRAALTGAFLLAAAAAVPVIGKGPAPDPALAAAIASPSRAPANVARDKYRHPAETLAFFGVKPGDTVVEIWPGGGWYTEILAPYLAANGTYYAAAPARSVADMQAKAAADPAHYGKVHVVAFPAVEGAPKVPDGSADVVLTFRNIHNWAGAKQPYAEEAFQEMYAMLKPGGTLGVVEHRLPADADPAREASSGYMKVATVKRLAEEAGFKFVGASEVNANPRDKADYPKGVWTLPPTYTLGDTDRAKYAAIGESDRMTLRFVKPRG